MCVRTRRRVRVDALMSKTREERGAMAVISTSQQAGGLARPNDWQAPLSAESFQPGPKNNRSKGMRTIRRIAWNLLPPLTFVAMVGLWWAAVELFKIPSYLLPGPGGVFSRLVTDTAVLWTHSKVTLTEILLGFGITVVMAIPLGLLIALSPLAKQLVYPPIVLMQLEELGFCGRGEAKDYIRDGSIEMTGKLPVNTHGGLLGEAYIHGVNNILEGVKQLRGTAANQVDNVEHVMVAAGRSAAVLGRL